MELARTAIRALVLWANTDGTTGGYPGTEAVEAVSALTTAIEKVKQ
jgi:hypothetical protein